MMRLLRRKIRKKNINQKHLRKQNNNSNKINFQTNKNNIQTNNITNKTHNTIQVYYSQIMKSKKL